MERKKIAIIGVGLIGGSLAIQLHEKKISSKLIGVDANAEHAKKRREVRWFHRLYSPPDAKRETMLPALPQAACLYDLTIE